MTISKQPPVKNEGQFRSNPLPASASPAKKKGPATKVIIKYDCGFGNSLYVRGTGADLDWNHGVLLKNVKPDEWVWETDAPFAKCEFKILLNDQRYEDGENHTIIGGSAIQFTPKF